LIEAFRAALFGKSFDWTSLGVSLAMTLAILFFSAYVFRKMERSFADVI
jgi:ABC-type polysaccharide/polyol phosphate export permease